MRDKDLKQMIKKLEELNKILEGAKGIPNLIKEAIEQGHNEEAKISVHKHADGTAETSIEGSTMGILITLAGLEKTILNKINAPVEVFELIKETVGTREA